MSAILVLALLASVVVVPAVVGWTIWDRHGRPPTGIW